MLDQLRQMDPILLSIVVFTFLMCVAGVGYLVFRAGTKERQIKERIDRIQTGRRAMDSAKAEFQSVRRTESQLKIKSLDRLLGAIVPKPTALRRRLARTGKKIPVAGYALWNLGLMIGVGFLFFKVLGMGPLVAVFAGIGLGLGLPHKFIGMMIKSRQKRILADFPEAIDVMVRGIKSGLPVTEAIRIVGNEVKGPLADEFLIMSDEIRIGKNIDEAMWESAKRIELPEFKFFVVSMAIQRETGGNLAETLQNLGNVLRSRRQVKLKVKAYSSEAKASAYIIGVLPFVIGMIVYTLNEKYIMQLFQDDRGHQMLAVGGVWMMIGIGIMAKMIKFEV